MLTREQIARYEEAIRGGRFFVYEGEEYRPPLVTVGDKPLDRSDDGRRGGEVRG